MPLTSQPFRISFILIIAGILLAGCAGPAPTGETVVPTSTRAETPTPSATPPPLPSQTSTTAPTQTETATPSATPTPTVIPAFRIPIIEYHDPDFKLNDQVQMTIPWFEDQLRWLSDNGYHTLSGDDMAAYLDGTMVFPQKSVVLSFDIGTAKRTIYTDSVIPTLKKYKFQAVVFILANDTVVVDKCGDSKHFCWADFKKWADEGVISIASHGLFHPDFTKLSTTEIRYEVETSRQVLLEKLGVNPIAFAYPFDSTSQNAINLVKAAGYKFAVAGNNRTELAAVANDPDRFKLPRVYPYSNTKIYPNLNGFNRPFGEVIANLSRPGAVVVVTGPTATLEAGGGNPADQILKFCPSLSSDSFSRLNILMNATFVSDISPQALANLPGMSTSPSCNVLANNHPDAIVVHYTVGDLTSSMFAFRQANGNSAHYLIDRDGKVVQMVPEGLSALHASCTANRATCVQSCPICEDGKGNLTEPYTRSIGIEIVNRGHIPAGTTVLGGVYEDFLRSFAYPYWEDYTPAQIDSLKVLVRDISERWKIPIDDNHVIGHYRVNQKVDPGPALNLFWSRSGNPAKPPIFKLP